VGDIFGYSNSVVSTLVPLTVMVTTPPAGYLHSRSWNPRCGQLLTITARAARQ